jgi:transposase
MSESEWTKILRWPGYRVYRSEINEGTKTLRLWVRGKRGNHKLECSGCGRRIPDIAETYEREVRDLPWSEYRTTVVIELYRVRCQGNREQQHRVLWPAYNPNLTIRQASTEGLFQQTRDVSTTIQFPCKIDHSFDPGCCNINNREGRKTYSRAGNPRQLPLLRREAGREVRTHHRTASHRTASGSTIGRS